MILRALLGGLASVGSPLPSGIGSRPRRQRGQGVVEYGIILGLSALLALVILVVFGDQVADIVQWIGRTVDAAAGSR